MGIEGFFGYLNSKSIEGAIVDHSIDDILEQIRLHREITKKTPKILFNLRAFNNYYAQGSLDEIFGCRFNIIKKEFESLLSSLKFAGADLVFVSKQNHIDISQDVRFSWLNEEYQQGLKFVEILTKNNSLHEINKALRQTKYSYPWQETTIHVLVQSAQKYGTFVEPNCLRNVIPSHIQMANEEKMFAICGLNTSYIHRGNYKILFPARNFRSPAKEMIFKEFDREKILNHFQFNFDQFQLFGVLGGKFDSSLEITQALKKYFEVRGTKKFEAIVEFVHKFAPPEKFPLQRDTMKKILVEIFGYADDQLMEDFEKSISLHPPLKFPNTCAINDEKIQSLIQSDSFSSIAECILYDIPILIHSPFLDVTAADMKTLKDLTLEWIERLAGIIFDSIENRRISIIYRMESGKLEEYYATPILPFGISKWYHMIENDISMNEKFDVLAHLIGNVISVNDLKTIPLEYMMHVIITTHLVKKNSMTLSEAITLTQTVCDKDEKGFIIYPNRVSARAFRVSALYEKMYSILLMCLSPLGLKEFMVDLTLDNVLFQNNLRAVSRLSFDEDAFKAIMKVIN